MAGLFFVIGESVAAGAHAAGHGQGAPDNVAKVLARLVSRRQGREIAPRVSQTGPAGSDLTWDKLDPDLLPNGHYTPHRRVAVHLIIVELMHHADMQERSGLTPGLRLRIRNGLTSSRLVPKAQRKLNSPKVPVSFADRSLLLSHMRLDFAHEVIER